MKILTSKNTPFFILAFFIWLALDLLTKYWASHFLTDPLSIIPSVLSFSLYLNKGVAFGFYFGRWLQIAASIVVLLIMLRLSSSLTDEARNPYSMVYLAMVFAGGLGNLLNRLYSGYVIDFIALKPFPVFNVADIGISVGLFLLLLTDLFSRRDPA